MLRNSQLRRAYRIRRKGQNFPQPPTNRSGPFEGFSYFYALVGLFPVELLDGLDVVGGELDVGGEAAVEGRHQRRPLVAVRQTQRVSELVRRGLQQVRACGVWKNEE